MKSKRSDPPISIVVKTNSSVAIDGIFAKVVTGVSLPNMGGVSIEGFWADKDPSGKNTNTDYTISFDTIQPSGELSVGDIVWIGFRFGDDARQHSKSPCKATLLFRIEDNTRNVYPYKVGKATVSAVVKGVQLCAFANSDSDRYFPEGFSITGRKNAYEDVVEFIVNDTINNLQSSFKTTIERIRANDIVASTVNGHDGVPRERKQYHAKRSLVVDGKNYKLPEGVLFLTEVSGVWLLAIDNGRGGSEVVTMDYLANKIPETDREFAELIYKQSKALEALAMSYTIISEAISGKE